MTRFSFICFLLSCLFAPAAWGDFTHVVKGGESLSGIARKYHLSVSTIQEANHLEEDKIASGTRPVIPKKLSGKGTRSEIRKTGSPGTAVSAAPGTYVVKKGDTLYKLGRKFRIRARDLGQLNGLDGGRLKTGQVLRLRPEPERRQEARPIEPAIGGEEIRAASGSANQPGPEKDQAGIEEERNKLLQVAQKFLGVKYRRGGTSAIYGLDCSGYVQKVFKTVGFDLPRTAREQFGVGLDVARDALRLGDLVFFKRNKDPHPSHVGIYLGDQKFIHASAGKRRVNIDSLDTRYFAARFIGGKRVGEMDENPGAKKPDAERAPVWETRFEPPCCPPDPPPLKED